MIRQLLSSHDNGQSMVIYNPKVFLMLHQLSTSHDNGQSIVIYHSCMKHAPSVVIV